jgi:ABC-2 type transport system ATP-binding protein
MSDSSDAVIRTHQLTKRYKDLTAVSNLNLEIHRGDIFGFLGPNGSGKTTTIGLMLGLLMPTNGNVDILGHDVQRERAVLRRVGAMAETAAFFPYLSGYDNLRVLSLMSDVPPKRIWEVLELVGMKDRAQSRFRTYSLGMRQRLGIAAALLSDPEILLLDEPTIGLDPAGMKEVRELVAELGRQGKTIFFCSHLLYEVEQICSRVAIIRRGKVLAEGKIAELLHPSKYVEVVVNEIARASEILRSVDWIVNLQAGEKSITLQPRDREASEVVRLLSEQGIYPSAVIPKSSTLEDFFLEVTGGEERQ